MSTEIIGNVIIVGIIPVNHFFNILVISPQIIQYCDFWPKCVTGSSRGSGSGILATDPNIVILCQNPFAGPLTSEVG